ncbi:RFA2 [Candida pseudojiufengensis]|uniref:RFA2 n=1 Tax=Candida pseudojiufengensis TaxID=497109 RepID=UPI002224A23E|nr:RFA2 [Candida pseudojiufengensis]KAI5965297.1 RFA2 [Candida pseudojiufengensis]
MTDYGNFGNYGGNYGDGGFTNTGYSQGGGFQENGENGSSQSNKLPTRSSITPLTIKQINDSTQPQPDGEFQVNNVSVNMVTFVGVLRKVIGNQTSILLTFEDGTGSLEIRKWIDENTTCDIELEKHNEFKDKYVSVSGSLKLYNNNKSVSNALIRPIEDSNQIIYHYLNAIYIHLQSQGVNLASSAVKGENSNNNGVGNGNDNGQMFVGDNMPMTERILEFIKDQSKSMQEGVNIEYICRKLEIPPNDGKRYCNELIEDGKIYAGFNEEAYLAI